MSNVLTIELPIGNCYYTYMKNAYVTRESLAAMLANDNREYVAHVIGRALVAIFQRQTEDERSMNSTNKWNSIGFSGADALSGSMTAKTYIKRKNRQISPVLEDWQVEKWLKPARNGFPRICKYADQLNSIAAEKAAKV